MNRTWILVLFAGASATAAADSRAGDIEEPVPMTDLAAAINAQPVGTSGTDRLPRLARRDTEREEEGEEDATSVDLTFGWQSRSQTDWWFRDTDARGRRTASFYVTLEGEQPLGEEWSLVAQVDEVFDAGDARRSNSPSDSVAVAAGLCRDLGAGFEVELGARYDDWLELHASRGDPWGPHAEVTWTVDALGGELVPYLWHHLRSFVGGSRHDTTWTTELGVEYETPLAEAWRLELATFAGRVDGSRTDPDVWALGARAGVVWDWSETASIGVWVGATRTSGADTSNRTLGAGGIELTFHF